LQRTLCNCKPTIIACFRGFYQFRMADWPLCPRTLLFQEHPAYAQLR